MWAWGPLLNLDCHQFFLYFIAFTHVLVGIQMLNRQIMTVHGYFDLMTSTQLSKMREKENKAGQPGPKD